MPAESIDLSTAVESLAQTKLEHRRILQVISGDAGMAPETRRTLVEHLLEEEDEHLAQIQGLAGGGATPGAAQPGAAGRALSVGSLRNPPPSPAATPGLSVGNLRID